MPMRNAVEMRFGSAARYGELEGELTAAIGLKSAAVVDVDLVAAHGLACAVDFVRDFDIERLVEGEGKR